VIGCTVALGDNVSACTRTCTRVGFDVLEGHEGLWENTGKRAGTLYAINHLERVPQPFPMTELIKVSDNQPISPDYGYSYTVVYAR